MLLHFKIKGFSDRRIADLLVEESKLEVIERICMWCLFLRELILVQQSLNPTCYMYSTYLVNESNPTTNKKIMVLGSNKSNWSRIEFDYCCVHASMGYARARLRVNNG